MKDHYAFATITTETLSKFLKTHIMQEMTEYYSKTMIGNYDNSVALQNTRAEPIKCLRAKNSVIN